MSDILLLTTLVICLFTDLKYRKIYNNVLIPTLIFGISFNVYNYGLEALVKSGLGFMLGLSLLLLPFIWGGIGAGDVKLLAAVGAIKGSAFVFYAFLGTGIAGGVIAIGSLIYQGKLLKVLKNLINGLEILFITRFKVLSFSADKKDMFPYGVAIFIGTLAAYVVG